MNPNMSKGDITDKQFCHYMAWLMLFYFYNPIIVNMLLDHGIVDYETFGYYVHQLNRILTGDVIRDLF